MFANLLSLIGSFVATLGTQGCAFLIFDEPKMPNSLIER